MKVKNKGFDPGEIATLQERVDAGGLSYIFDDKEEHTPEYAHFYFIGIWEGLPVIYDTVMYTLRLHHNSEVYEIAEQKAAIKFPEFKSISYDEDKNGDMKSLDDLDEKIGLYMAEVIMDLEADESIKVQEHVELDKNIDFGIGLDVGLNREEIGDEVINDFIVKFNEDTLELDKTLYSFELEDEEIIE